jgi:hypothetical protein
MFRLTDKQRERKGVLSTLNSESVAASNCKQLQAAQASIANRVSAVAERKFIHLQQPSVIQEKA